MIAATGGSAFLLVWKRRRVFSAVREFVAGIVSLVEIRPKLELIVKELTSNGGSSLKDNVGKLGVRVDVVEHDVKQLKEANDRQTEILEGQNRTLAKQDEVLDEFGKRIDRLITHQAKNDLHYSALFREAEARRQAEQDKPKP